MTTRRPIVSTPTLAELPVGDALVCEPIDLVADTAPADPPAGIVRLYARTDSSVGHRDSGGTEVVLG